MKRSMTSKSSALRPSIATTLPFAISRPGSGSFGPSIATSPSSGYGEIRSSRRSPRCSRETKRSDRRAVIRPQQAPLGAGGGRLADEGGAERGRELALQPLRPGFELLRGRAVGPQRRIDLEDGPARNRGELGRPREVVRELRPAGRERHRRLAAA